MLVPHRALILIWSVSTGYVRVRLLVAAGLAVLSAACTAIAPAIFKFAVDDLTAKASAPLEASIYEMIFAYVAVLYFARGASEQRMRLIGVAEQRLHLQLSSVTNAHCFNLPLGYHWSQPIGTIEKTLDQGLRGCESILRQLLSTLLPVGIELIAVCIILIHLKHPLYFAIFGGAIVAYAIIYGVGARLSGKTAKAVSSARIETGAFLNDGFLCIEMLKSFRAVRWFLSLYEKHLRGVESLWHRYYRSRHRTGQLAALVYAVSALAALLFTVRGITRGQLTVGDLFLIQAYLFRLLLPLEQLGIAAREFSQGIANLDRLLTLLRMQPEPDNTRQHSGPSRGEIAFRNVSFAYAGAPQKALHELNFTIHSGSTVAVVGANGSGKSTLGRLLLRHHEPNTGRIELDGIALTEMSRDDLGEIIVTVSQETILLHTTLRNNITLGADVDELQTARVLRLAQLDKVVADLPDGLDTVVGQRGMRLSGGQRQRVAIARALLKGATVILCDEATAALDPRAEQDLVPVLMQLTRRQTTIFITHRESIAERADTVLFLDRGELVNQGTHASLLADKTYARLWGYDDSVRASGIVGVTS